MTAEVSKKIKEEEVRGAALDRVSDMMSDFRSIEKAKLFTADSHNNIGFSLRMEEPSELIKALNEAVLPIIASYKDGLLEKIKEEVKDI